jgi:hypothetical protein
VLIVTADSNIYISAIMFGGRPLQLLEMAIAREIQLVIPDAILHEVLEVLREKFHQTDDRMTQVMVGTTPMMPAEACPSRTSRRLPGGERAAREVSQQI